MFHTFLVLLSGMHAHAQEQGRRQMISGRHVYGKIIDAGNAKPIEAATVLLVTAKKDSSTHSRDKVIRTGLSDKIGEFDYDNINTAGQLALKISAIGYKTIEIAVLFGSKGNLNADVGNIKLQRDEVSLQAVTVKAGKSLLQLNLDKKIYNVEKDISASGGTAVDVMKNVPSVNVDIDGNVTLRNAPPQIFVDGRPTTLTLDQIPADQIESVEIMTNPSAKYDASGGGSGILNIVLKKNRKSGYNGNLRASIDNRGKPTFGADLNFKQNKVNFFAAGNLAFRKSKSRGFSTRIDSIPNGLVQNFQNNSPVNTNVFSFGRLGLDYLMGNRNTLTVSAGMVDGDFSLTDLYSIYSDTITTTRTWKQNIVRNLDVDAGFTNYSGNMGFKHTFARANRELTADANYNHSMNSNTSNYKNKLYDDLFNPLPEQGGQRATGGGNAITYTFQSDYADPYTATRKIELGMRAAFRSNKSWNDNYIQDVPSGKYVLIPEIGVQYKYSDRVLAAYATYSQEIHSFSYQLGLRAENSEYTGNYITRNQQFSNAYPLSLFPTAFLTYKISEKKDIQLNYSRKINRPNFFQLIPFVDFSDSLNLSVGNPSLKPEFTHLIEFVYSLQYREAQSALVSVYAKLTNDLITRYQFRDSTINPLKPGRYLSYANADNSVTTGIEITGRNKIASWWDITSSLNIFYVKINSGNLTGNSNRELGSYFAKMNNNFKLGNNFTLQFSGEYQAKTILPPSSANSRGGSTGMLSFGGGIQSTAQGYIRPSYGADLALKKEFLKNNAASLTLQFTDIFRSRVYSIHSDADGFSQDNRRYRDPQLLRLNFNLRFGKFDAALFRRKSSRSADESNQGLQGPVQ